MATTDARPLPRKGIAYRHYFAIRATDCSLVTSWAGQDSQLSGDGGAFTDCTNEATEIGSSGIGYLDLTAAEMDYDAVAVKITVTNTGAIPYVVMLFPEEGGDLRADAVQISGSATAADNLETAALAYSATRGLAGTALPAAAADAAGGLPISDAGSLDLDLKLANTNEVTAARMGALTDWINGGRLDLILDAIAADVVNLDGAAMRGTDSAALASVCTEARLAELDTANLPADVDSVLASMATAEDVATAVWEFIINPISYEAVVGSSADYLNNISGTPASSADVTNACGVALLLYDGSSFSAIPDMATATAQAIIAGYLDTEIGTIITAVGTTIPALIGTPAVDLATDLAAAQTDLDTITDTGVSLVATGLDAITATEPTAKPTNFREWLMWLVQRYRRSSKTTTVLTVSTEAGAAVTTQVITDDGAGTETLGPPT